MQDRARVQQIMAARVAERAALLHAAQDKTEEIEALQALIRRVNQNIPFSESLPAKRGLFRRLLRRA